MTEKDKQLIEKAKMCGRDWETIIMLENEAESEEAKKMLHNICVRSYHRDESYDI